MTTDAQAPDPDNESIPAPEGGWGETPGKPAEDPGESQPAPLSVKTDVRHVALVILTVLALLYTLRFAQAFFLPIVLAILLNFLLSPVVRLLRNSLRIPEPLGAGIVLVVLLGVLVFGVTQLAPAASA